jgi:hypothetical protein
MIKTTVATGISNPRMTSLLPDMLARLAFTQRDIACHDSGSAEIMPYSKELHCIAIQATQVYTLGVFTIREQTGG